MDTSLLDLVRRRQSVRDYTHQPVAREVIERCLEAARLAPSACNSQPWHFVVADRDPLRQRLANAALGGAFAMNAFAREAPVLVTAIAERSRLPAAVGGWLRGTPYHLIDLGIACEHLVLQATAEGLGSCWLGWFDAGAAKRILGLPRRVHAAVMISLGYPATARASAAPRKPLDAIRHYVE